MFSLVFNICLFDLMPYLINHRPSRPEFSQLLESVNIIRIKRSETPVRKKEKKHKIKPRDEVKKLEPKKMVHQNLIMKQPVDLSFEINSKLPPISGTLKVPSMKTVHLGPMGLYEIGEIDRPLVPLAQVPPVYPMRARRMGIEGWVKVRFVVEEDGRVGDVKILGSSPKNIFENTVIRCVSSWRFKPGTVEGVPVSTWVETTIRFDLE